MPRRFLILAAVVFAAFMLAMVIAGVYVVVRPEEGGVRAARELVERVETPGVMRLAGAGTDQKTPYRDYLMADDAFDELAGVRPPPGYELRARFRDGGGPFPSGDWQIIAEFGPPRTPLGPSGALPYARARGGPVFLRPRSTTIGDQ